MRNKKYEIIENKTEAPCGRCGGSGRINETVKMVPGCEICPQCNGTGKYIDKTYTLVAGGMSFDMSTIK